MTAREKVLQFHELGRGRAWKMEMHKEVPGESRLALAQRLFQEYYATCFWYSPSNLRITEELIPFVRKGLRAYGGRRGFVASAKLRNETPKSI